MESATSCRLTVVLLLVTLSSRAASEFTGTDTRQQTGPHRTAFHTPLSSDVGQFLRLDAAALLSRSQSEKKNPTHRLVFASRGCCQRGCVQHMRVHGYQWKHRPVLVRGCRGSHQFYLHHSQLWVVWLSMILGTPDMLRASYIFRHVSSESSPRTVNLDNKLYIWKIISKSFIFFWVCLTAGLILRTPGVPVSEGDTVVLQCQYLTASHSETIFLKNEEVLTFNYSSHAQVVKMTLENVTQEDEGYYKCASQDRKMESPESWLSVRPQEGRWLPKTKTIACVISVSKGQLCILGNFTSADWSAVPAGGKVLTYFNSVLGWQRSHLVMIHSDVYLITFLF